MDTTPDPRGHRLIKALLPTHLVVAMDEMVTRFGAYSDRSQFIADAIDSHITEIRAARELADLPVAGTPEPPGGPSIPVSLREAHTGSGGVISSISEIAEGVPTLAPKAEPNPEPTWGMHNRDFPSLWALLHLAERAHSVGEPVDFPEWLSQVVTDAWAVPRRLPSNRFDTSGFPKNPAKAQASEGRFVRFFIGDEPGTGPLFDLGLAGTGPDNRVAPTGFGLTLLRNLDGFGCERGQVVRPDWTDAYLRHLSAHAPKDLRFMKEVIVHILDGRDDRSALLEVVKGSHPTWSSSVVGTNIAGFIARAREWGLVSPHQRKGKYLLDRRALTALEKATNQ